MNRRNRRIAVMLLIVAIVVGLGLAIFDQVKTGWTASFLIVVLTIVVVAASEFLDRRASNALRRKLPPEYRDLGGAP